MFESLTEKFSEVFRKMSGRGRLSEDNVRESMREVRTALLEADVHYEVVKKFCDDVTEKALGTEVIKSLHPGQLMVKIVHDELTALMGPVDTRIYFVSPPPTEPSGAPITVLVIWTWLSRAILASSSGSPSKLPSTNHISTFLKPSWAAFCIRSSNGNAANAISIHRPSSILNAPFQ